MLDVMTGNKILVFDVLRYGVIIYLGEFVDIFTNRRIFFGVVGS